MLEVGAGTGTNFAFYPATVTEVVAVEPEVRLAPQAQAAAEKAPVPVTVSAGTVEKYLSNADDTPFDAVVCSLVLCSVDDPDDVLRQLFSLVRPGGELRFLEHVGTGGFRGRLQKVADATVWPRMMGNCHTHRDTESSIVGAGFTVDRAPSRIRASGLVPDAGRRLHDRPRRSRPSGKLAEDRRAGAAAASAAPPPRVRAP